VGRSQRAGCQRHLVYEESGRPFSAQRNPASMKGQSAEPYSGRPSSHTHFPSNRSHSSPSLAEAMETPPAQSFLGAAASAEPKAGERRSEAAQTSSSSAARAAAAAGPAFPSGPLTARRFTGEPSTISNWKRRGAVRRLLFSSMGRGEQRTGRGFSLPSLLVVGRRFSYCSRGAAPLQGGEGGAGLVVKEETSGGVRGWWRRVFMRRGERGNLFGFFATVARRGDSPIKWQ
jgi:hypothetical protein